LTSITLVLTLKENETKTQKGLVVSLV